MITPRRAGVGALLVLGLAVTATGCSEGSAASSKTEAEPTTTTITEPVFEPPTPETRVFDDPEFVTTQNGDVALAVSCNGETNFNNRAYGFVTPIAGTPTSTISIVDVIGGKNENWVFGSSATIRANTEGNFSFVDEHGIDHTIHTDQGERELQSGTLNVSIWFNKPDNAGLGAGVLAFQAVCELNTDAYHANSSNANPSG